MTFAQVQKMFSMDYGSDLIMKYQDLEGDTVTIKSQSDMEQFFDNVSKEKTPRLLLEDNTNPRKSTDMSKSTNNLNKSFVEPSTPSSPKNPFGMQPTKRKNIKWSKGPFLGAGAFGVVYLGMNEGM